MSAKPHPVVFIHGLWIHADSWQPWQNFFRDRGYTTYAPGWPGDRDDVEQTRAHPEAVAEVGFDDVVTHHAAFIAGLATPPILVGHSFGGVIAEKMLGQDRAVAAIAIDAPPIKGTLRAPLSAIRAALPMFRNPANRHRAISLTREQFRFSLANAASAAESDELYDRWTIPTPGRLLFEAGLASSTPDSPDALATQGNCDRGPLLLVMVGRDRAIPEAITKGSYGLYGEPASMTDVLKLGNHGHSLTIDAGWPQLADDCVLWLEKRGL